MHSRDTKYVIILTMGKNLYDHQERKVFCDDTHQLYEEVKYYANKTDWIVSTIYKQLHLEDIETDTCNEIIRKAFNEKQRLIEEKLKMEEK